MLLHEKKNCKRLHSNKTQISHGYSTCLSLFSMSAISIDRRVSNKTSWYALFKARHVSGSIGTFSFKLITISSLSSSSSAKASYRK